MQLQGDMMFVKALLHRTPKVSISTTESNHQFSQTQLDRHNYWLFIHLHSSICRISAGDRRTMIGIDLMVVWVESSLVWWGKHFLPVSRWDADVLHSESGQANVLRTQYLRSSFWAKRCEAEEGTNQPCLQSFASDVERTVGRSHVTNPYQKNIY